MMYRPKGWENPHSTLPEHMELEYPVLPEWSAYEAGADAMLEGLRKQGVTLSIADQKIDVPGFHIVFIPEEGEMKEQTYLDVIYHSQEGDYPLKLCFHLARNYLKDSRNRLLDIGCGKGTHMAAFHQLGFIANGIDKPLVNLEQDKIYFKDNTFDVVFSKSCIEHISNTENVLSETYRVLKPGGVAIFMTPDWATDYKYFWDDPTHVRPFTRKGLQNAFLFAGFVDVECKHFWQLPFLWRYPFLEPLRWIISLLPNRFKWKDREQSKQRVLIRHAKERMLLCVARKGR